MEKLLLVDGSGLLFQSFYGMPRQIKNSCGQRVEAVICFVGILLKQIKSLKPDKLFIIFDGETHLNRKDQDKDYKANRIDYSAMAEEDTPFCQLQIIKKVLDYLNFEWYETTFCEADDIIASLVNDNKDKFKIIISSADKDFYQLVQDNVSIFTYRGKASVMVTPEFILNRYGIAPNYFADYKALVGDASDNIKGISGIGPKTASKLITKHGSITSILENVKPSEDKFCQNILSNKDKLLTNYKIIELFSKTGLYSLPDCSFITPNVNSIEILKRLGIL